MPKKRRGRPKTTGTGTLVQCRVHEEFLTRLDRWRQAQKPELSRPAAMIRLTESALKTADPV
jgi:hypothetical protein